MVQNREAGGGASEENLMDEKAAGTYRSLAMTMACLSQEKPRVEYYQVQSKNVARHLLHRLRTVQLRKYQDSPRHVSMLQFRRVAGNWPFLLVFFFVRPLWLGFSCSLGLWFGFLHLSWVATVGAIVAARACWREHVGPFPAFFVADLRLSTLCGTYKT